MLLYFPILNRIFAIFLEKKIPFIIPFLLLTILNFKTGVYLIIFSFGMLFAYYDLFAKMLKYSSHDLLTKIALSIILISISIYLRVVLAMKLNIFGVYFDFIIVPIFIYIILLFRNLTRFYRFLYILGKYSFYIWLIHTFIAYYYWQDIALIPQYGFFIAIWVLFLSLVISIFLDKVYKKLNCKRNEK